MSRSPPSVVAGRYRVDGPLGSGAMGSVWAATDLETQRDVALKIPHAWLAASPSASRFVRESNLGIRLRSPYVCRVLATVPYEDRHALVLERLHGETLRALLHRDGTLSVARVATVMDAVLAALVAIHDAAILHRDLKPSNVFLPSGAGDVAAKVLDFGIAAAAAGSDENDTGITGPRDILGSAFYAAPEQLTRDAPVDERSDIYGAVAVALHALVGRPPFLGKNAAVVGALKADHDAPSLHDLTQRGWPAPLEAFFADGLARDPARRLESARDARDRWRAVASALAPNDGDGPFVASKTEIPTGTAWRPGTPERRRSKV